MSAGCCGIRLWLNSFFQRGLEHGAAAAPVLSPAAPRSPLSSSDHTPLRFTEVFPGRRVGDLRVLDVEERPLAELRGPRCAAIELSADYTLVLLQARTPQDLHQLFPSFLEPFVIKLDISEPHPDWTLQARPARAFRAGVSALRVNRFFHKQANSASLPFDNRIYVVIRSEQFPEGCCTWSCPTYCRVLATADGLQAGSISHAFPRERERLRFFCEAATSLDGRWNWNR